MNLCKSSIIELTLSMLIPGNSNKPLNINNGKFIKTKY